ncbi:hypothetical protein OROGR_027032 [Orobanche gracilis]
MACFFTRTQIFSLLLLFFLFASFSEARDHVIDWKNTSPESDSLNRWAEKSRFRIGDSLVLKYNGSGDSVLQVTSENYVTCNTSSPIENYTGGINTVKLEQSGPYYFVSGGKGQCQKGQKLTVVVMSEKHRRLVFSPAPSPSEVEGPTVAPAPTSGAGGSTGGFLVLALGAILVVM